MKRFTALFCALFLISSFAFADDNMDRDESDDETSEISSEVFHFNEPGDQFIKIDLMVTWPLNFGGSFPLYKDGQLSIGGAGSLGYHRFLTNNIALGLNVRFGYHPTIGENIFTYIPLLFNVTYQPTIGRFEFPISIGIGAAMENYLNRTYFPGLVVEPRLGIYYRVSPGWSFGLEGNFDYMPQWYSDSQYNDYGIFASCALSARYHF